MKGATELPAYSLLEAEVILSWNSSSVCREHAASVTAVDVEGVKVTHLPELCCGSTCCMFTDICIVYWQTGRDQHTSITPRF